jgi:hypothetical protein
MVNKALALFVKHANEKDALKRAMINRKIAMVMRGWVGDNQNGNPQLKYNHQRRDLFHLWSAKNFGHTFGSREYSKFLSLKDCLEMPIDLMDDILEGVGRGQEDLAKQKKAAADRAAAQAASGHGMNKSELAALQAAQRGDK